MTSDEFRVVKEALSNHLKASERIAGTMEKVVDAVVDLQRRVSKIEFDREVERRLKL